MLYAVLQKVSLDDPFGYTGALPVDVGRGGFLRFLKTNPISDPGENPNNRVRAKMSGHDAHSEQLFRARQLYISGLTTDNPGRQAG